MPMKTTEQKRGAKVEQFTPAEQRSARADRVKVFAAEPDGWLAQSESGVASAATPSPATSASTSRRC